MAFNQSPNQSSNQASGQFNSELIKITAIVKNITFHAPDSGYMIIKVNSVDNIKEDIAMTLYQAQVFAGATMDFFGYWTTHPKYGLQFTVKQSHVQKPATVQALERYIGSGLIKGVGPMIAKRIVKHFGKETLEVFDKNIHRLEEVSGITKNKITIIQECWIEHQQIRQVMIFLQDYGISTLFAVKIYKTYGDKSIQILSDNPYRLASDIYGIGFLSADKIALKMKIPPTSNKRLIAGINFVLQSAREDGHCYLTLEQIQLKTVKNLNQTLLSYYQHEVVDLSFEDIKTDELVRLDMIIPALDQMEKTGDLKIRMLHGTENIENIENQELEKCYYAKSIYHDEDAIVERIKTLQKNSVLNKTNKKKFETWLDEYSKTHKIQLSDEQLKAVLDVVTSKISVLTGGPGCGKTTTTKIIVEYLKYLKKTVSLCAPTGRAAQRMTEVIGLPAKTIHRLLEFDLSAGGFKINLKNQLLTDFLIVDESSMLDVHLAAAIFRSIKDTSQILLIGDIDQLPSVGAGNILKDIINSGVVKVCRLQKIFRQAEGSNIVQFAHQINKGSYPKIPTPFQNSSLWKATDCLFLDSEEATLEQLNFIKKAKNFLTQKPLKLTKNEIKESLDDPILSGESEAYFQLPKKFEHVDINQLVSSQTSVEELKVVLKKIHPFSTLNYGMNASETIIKIYTDTIPKYFPNKEIQILCPMTKGSLGSLRINQLIQEATNSASDYKPQIQIGSSILRLGDRVIQKINNYSLNVFNGDIGQITEIDTVTQSLFVRFTALDGYKEVKYEKSNIIELSLAYAITIHKSQGSEFGVVIIPIVTQHFQMLFRNLIYTGLTRGKNMVVFVGSRKALNLAVKNLSSDKRQTGLMELLKNI